MPAQIQDLLRTNLEEGGGMGTLVSQNERIQCYHTRDNENKIECEVYAPWKTACAYCQHLKDTFTEYALSDVLSFKINEVLIDCDLTHRYRMCKV